MATELYQGPLAATALTVGSSGSPWTVSGGNLTGTANPSNANVNIFAAYEASGFVCNCGGLSGTSTESLTFTGFCNSSTLPAGAVIDNIAVNFWQKGGALSTFQLILCELVGAPGTAVNVADSTFAGTSVGQKSMSGGMAYWSSDTTNADWVSAINSAAFGVELQWYLNTSSGGTLYAVQLVIEYHLPGASGIWHAQSLGVM